MLNGDNVISIVMYNVIYIKSMRYNEGMKIQLNIQLYIQMKIQLKAWNTMPIQ